MSRTKMSVLAVITMVSLFIGSTDTEAGHRRHKGGRHRHNQGMYGSHGCCGGGFAGYGSGGHGYGGTGYGSTGHGSTGYGAAYNRHGGHYQNSGVVNYGGYGSGTSHGNAYATGVCCY